MARQKIQARNLNKYIAEQLPVVPPAHYESVCFGPKTAGEIVREAVLELTYTAHDMAPFAHDMGHVDAAGDVLPPFVWDEERRLFLRAKLDAVFFHLYGVTDRDDVRYVYSTFPIVEREETAAYGTYRSRDLCLAWLNALAAGDPDAEIALWSKEGQPIRACHIEFPEPLYRHGPTSGRSSSAPWSGRAWVQIERRDCDCRPPQPTMP